MVSANFLAQLDMHMRSVMSHACGGKTNTDGIDRPFGGVNVLFCGDFYQLEPPAGTPLNAIPTSWIRKARQYAPNAEEDHGHHIFWGSGEGSVAGMTELVECWRVEGMDEWFLCV